MSFFGILGMHAELCHCPPQQRNPLLNFEVKNVQTTAAAA